MICFDDFSAVDSHLRGLAADWIKKGDSALLAFANGQACDCPRLIVEVQSAVDAAAKRAHPDRNSLRQIEIIARNHLRSVRTKQRIEAAVHVAVDAGTDEAELVAWVADCYERVRASRVPKPRLSPIQEALASGS